MTRLISCDLLYEKLIDTISTQIYNNLPYNIAENENCYEIDVIIPGVEKENIIIEYNDNILKINCDRTTPDKKYIVQTFENKKYLLKINIPGIDFTNSSGEYENGILKLNLPKSVNSSERLILK